MRHRLGLSLAIVLAGASLPLATVAAHSATPAGTPKVLTCAGKVVVRPAGYVLSCADANAYFTGLSWQSWGTTAAVATGTFVQNSCEPSCAAGRFVKHSARLTLSLPRPTKYGLLYSAARYSYTVTAGTTLPLNRLADVSPARRPRCSLNPAAAAEFVIPPAPFAATDIVVEQIALPPGEPAGGGASLKRLYRVRFLAVTGNAVLPTGHTYTQFSYVSRATTSAPWCFLKGGSGP